MAITTVGDLNSLYNLIYEKARFVARDMNLMVNLVDNRSASGYMARKISERPQVTATTKAEGSDFSSPTTFGRTLLATLTPDVAFAQVLLTDEDMQTDPDNATRDAAMEGGMAIAQKIDDDLANDMASFTTDKGATTTALTIAKCAAALAVLRNNSVPGPFTFVLHPYGWHDVWTELGQPAANDAFLGDVANEAMRQYFVGNFLAAQWFVNANINADATPDAISGVFTRSAIMFDTREPFTMEPQRDASRKATELNFSAGYAHGVVKASYGIKLTHDATEPA